MAGVEVSSEGVVGETNGTQAVAVSEIAESMQLFSGWWRLMEATGKPLKIADQIACENLWKAFSLATAQRVVEWTVEQLATTWTSARYTPMPQRILEEQNWERVAKKRLIPTPKTESKSEQATRRAGEIARETWGYE